MDDPDQSFIDTFRRFLEEVIHRQPARGSELTPLGLLVQRHLGTDVAALPVVSETIARHRLIDADIALELLGGEDAQLVGVTGGQQRFQEDLPQLLSPDSFASLPARRLHPGGHGC